MKTITELSTALKLTAVVRVSRRNGREGSAFMSPTEQRERIEADARARGAVIVAWHDETDSVSGKTVKRVGLQAAVADIESGKADGLIVAKLDRFSRNATEGLLLLRHIKSLGKRFIAVSEGIDLGAKSSPNGKLILGIFLNLAEWQLETLTLGWETTRERHIAHGVGTGEPFGYRKGAGRVLKPEPTEVAAVALAFELHAEGASWQAIADTLTEKGYRPRKAERFTHARISSLIASRVYLGEVRSGDYVNTSAHEAIVSVELWERANGQRKTAARREATPFMLAGLVRSATCGVRAKGESRVRDGKAQRYYRCRVNHSFGKCEHPVTVNADELEAMVLGLFRDRFLDVELEADDVRVDHIAEAQLELEACEREVREYLTDSAVTALKRIDEGAWRDGLDARSSALEAAQLALTEARNAVHGLDLPSDLTVTLDELPVEEVRGFLSNAFEVIAVAPSSRARRIPLAERVGVWCRDETSAPGGFMVDGRAVKVTIDVTTALAA